MKMLFIIMFLCSFNLSATVYSSEDLLQQLTITGVVTDTFGDPLPGVSILIKGTTQGTASDANGAYSIQVPNENAVLVFAFIGFDTKEIVVGNRSAINVTLADVARQLEEVVVVAYGTALKRNLTGSVTNVDSKVLNTQSNSTVTRALEGTVPGLQVVSVDGQPGLDMGIRVRGLGSANANSANALIVIDGVPNSQSNVLASVNSKDIESITVLKDAASTALYGALGANGVILINTKQGKPGKAKVSYDGRFGINQRGPGKYEKLDDPKDIYEWAWLSIYNAVRYKGAGGYVNNVGNPNMSHDEAAKFASQHLFNYTGAVYADDNDNRYTRNALGNYMLYNVPGARYTQTGLTADGRVQPTLTSATMNDAYLVGLDGKLNPNATLLYHDPYDDYFITSKFRQEHNISISGANDKIDYFVSTGYLQDPSYIPGSKFDRYTVRARMNAKVYNWLKTGFSTAYGHRAMQSPATRYGRNPGSVVQNIFRWTDNINPLTPVWRRDESGRIVYDDAGAKLFNRNNNMTFSPLGPTIGPSGTTDYDLDYMFDHDKDITTTRDISLNGYVEAYFLKDFTFTLKMATDNYFETRDRYLNPLTGAAFGNDGAMGQTYQNTYNINSQQLLRWDKKIDRHVINVLLGHEFIWWKQQNLNYMAAYSLIPDFFAFANFVGFNTGSTFAGTGGNMNKTAMESYFGRVNYIANDKYYLDLSLRRDGSSKFKLPENRWGTFWSVGGGWRISSEDFMAGVKASWLDDLKIRASFGEIGNQNGIGYYSGYQTWGLGTPSRNYSGTSWSPQGYTLSQGAWANDGLTWEVVAIVDAGVDFRLWNRVYGSVDWYQRTTKNAIWNEPIAYSLGQASLQRNSAQIRNAGIEFDLGFDIIKTRDMLWSISINGTHYRTTVVSVPPGTGSEELNGNWIADDSGWSAAGTGSTGGGYYLRGIGKDYYNTYLYIYGGVDQKTGLPLYKAYLTQSDIDQYNATPNDLAYADVLDSNGQVRPLGSDFYTTSRSLAKRYENGSAVPKFIGGFSTTFAYKGFDFNALFSYQLGGKFLSVQYANHLYQGNHTIGGVVARDLKGNTWTPENTTAKFPMQVYTGETYSGGATLGSWMYTDLAQFNASYFNVKNIAVGYTLSKKTLEKVLFVESLRFYGSVDNMWIFSAKPGVDPRMSLIGGMDVGAFTYPYMRTMNVGVNIIF